MVFPLATAFNGGIRLQISDLGYGYMETRQSDQKPQKILIVDDHESVLSGTVNFFKKHYPATEIVTAQTVMSALQELEQVQPDLMLMDLSIPKSSGDSAQTDNGIQFLRQLMQQYSALNIVVQSAYAKTLVRLKPDINAHEGGFTIADKSLPVQEMLIRVNWALQGVVCTPREMRTGLELKHEWIQVLRLAFEEGLQDKAIAERIGVSERTVRHYWTRVQNALGVYPEDNKNIRIQTEIQARKEGLID